MKEQPKTRLVVCLTALLAAGCSDVTPQQLRTAEEICSDRQGIRNITAYTLKRNVVWCGDDSSEFIEVTSGI